MLDSERYNDLEQWDKQTIIDSERYNKTDSAWYAIHAIYVTVEYNTNLGELCGGICQFYGEIRPQANQGKYDDVIKWKHFPPYCPFVRGIHRWLVNYPHKGQWCRALMFSLICAWTKAWVNNRDAGDLRRHRVHYDVTVMNTNTRLMISTSLIW